MSIVSIEKIEKAEIVNFPSKRETSRKFKKDGTPKETYSSSHKGSIKRVYPFKTEKEIMDVINYYEIKLQEAKTENQRLIAGRNIVLIIVGINLGIRASDLLKLKWEQVFREDGTFIEEDDEEEIREQKTGKIKGLIYNQACRDAIMEYIERFNIEINPKSYVFKSREKGAISVQTCSNILQEAAKACGIRRRIGSHSLRKTFSYFQIKAHNNDATFINELQSLLNHSSQEATLAYCGINAEKLKEYHNDVNLGKKCVIKNNLLINVRTDDLNYLISIIGKDTEDPVLKSVLERYGY